MPYKAKIKKKSLKDFLLNAQASLLLQNSKKNV